LPTTAAADLFSENMTMDSSRNKGLSEIDWELVWTLLIVALLTGFAMAALKKWKLL